MVKLNFKIKKKFLEWVKITFTNENIRFYLQSINHHRKKKDSIVFLKEARKFSRI